MSSADEHRKYIPKANDWRSEHYTPRNSDENCIIKICPMCGKLACLDFHKDIKNEGYKVPAFRHGHFLKEQYEQKRNYNHLWNEMRVKLKPGELVESTRLKHAKVPDFIADKFEDP